MKIRSFGSTSRLSIRTLTRASKVAARTGEFLPCLAPVRCIPHIRHCHWAPWIGTSPATTNMVVIAAAAVHHFHQMQPAAPTPDQTAATTTTHTCTPVIHHMEVVMMIWSSQNGRCTNDARFTHIRSKNHTRAAQEQGLAAGEVANVWRNEGHYR